MNIEEELAQAISAHRHNATVAWPEDARLARALMPLVRRAQAEAEVRALRDAADEIKATFTDPDRHRPRDPKGEVATDYVNDSQWAELIVRNRADRIEQEVEHE